MRNYMIIGREVFHKHPDAFTSAEWTQARSFIALGLLEADERDEERESNE